MKHQADKHIRMARYLAGEMEPGEEIAYREKLNSQPAELIELERMEKSWRTMNHHSLPGNDSREAWNMLYQRMENDGLLEEEVPVRPRGLSPVFRIAASILLLVATGITLLYLGNSGNTRQGAELHHEAEKGVQTVDLPDGSRVFMNKGSEMTVSSGYERERSVDLSGEAYFEVMSDPGHPFKVRSGNVVVSVLGTSFNVRPGTSEGNVEVFVTSGSVRVILEQTGEFMILTPGQIGQAGITQMSASDQADPNYLAWKTKDFKFVDAELSEVLNELEESYHVHIHADDETVEGKRITTTYEQQSIDAILQTVGTAFGFSVSKQENHYYLK